MCKKIISLISSTQNLTSFIAILYFYWITRFNSLPRFSKYYNKNKPANWVNNRNRLNRSNKRSCLKHEEMLRHLSNAHNLTMHETEQLLDLLVGNCDGWLQIIDISDARYVKKIKVDMSVQQVKQVIDEKMKSLSWHFYASFFFHLNVFFVC